MTALNQEIDDGNGLHCHYCPLIIKPMQDVLTRATLISQLHPECLSRESVVVAELLAIGVVENFAAAHMARTAGGVYDFMRYCGFPIAMRNYAFWAIPGHDEGKVVKTFYESIAWDGRPIEGLIADPNLPEPAKQRIDRSKLANIVFEHNRYSPLGTRILHDCLNWPIDRILKLRLIVGPLHHLLGSGMPTIDFEEGKPHISELVYHKDYPEDRELVEFVAATIIQMAKEINSIEDLIAESTKSEEQQLATITIIATLLDIIDALHRRPYLLHQDPKPNDIESILYKTRIPKYLIEIGMSWYREFGSPANYYSTVITSGWKELAAPILRSHAETHYRDESCSLTELVLEFLGKIKPQAHINRWANEIVVPNLHFVTT